LVVVAALAEQPVVDDVVDVELVQQRVAVLGLSACGATDEELTLDTLAVNTTTSYNSPTRFMNWSTPGRFMT
jgi:hypothetical protein